MPTNEKELNVNLFDQLEIVERIRREAKRGGIDAVMEQLDIEQAAIERKLNQKLNTRTWQKTIFLICLCVVPNVLSCPYMRMSFVTEM